MYETVDGLEGELCMCSKWIYILHTAKAHSSKYGVGTQRMQYLFADVAVFMGFEKSFCYTCTNFNMF